MPTDPKIDNGMYDFKYEPNTARFLKLTFGLHWSPGLFDYNNFSFHNAF